MKHGPVLLCGAIGGALIACSMAMAEVEVRLRERIVASSPVVRLGDVAEVVAADSESGRRLEARLLMPAPAPETQRFLRQREIIDLLSAQGDDVSQLHFSGPAMVEVAAAQIRPASNGAVDGRGFDREAVLREGRAIQPPTPARRVSEPRVPDELVEHLREELRLAVIDYLTVKAGHPDAWRVSCDVAERHLAQLRLATSKLKCFGGIEPWTGKQRMLVSFTTTDGVIQVPILAEVALASKVVTVVRHVERGGTITAAHVALTTVDYTPQASERRVPIESVEEIIGMEARQSLRPGDIVFTDQIQPPLMVKRGDMITVISQGGGIRVQTTARARQDGTDGELIQVEALETKQAFDARVTGLREATVFTATPAVKTPPEFQRTEAAWRR